MTETNSSESKLSTDISKLRLLTQTTKFWRSLAIILFIMLVFNQLFEVSIAPKSRLFGADSTNQTTYQQTQSLISDTDLAALSSQVLPDQGVELPISWGDMGRRMVQDGVIDDQQFRSLFDGGLTSQEESMLSGTYDGPIVLNLDNSRYILNLLWAFGLGNKNPVLDSGDMMDPQISGGNPGNFAATGGWPLSRGEAMDHYSAHSYIQLTDDQQDMVERVAKGIFRPCCGNSTYFPDCNHGMAMLGLLQLMAANGIDEDKMYEVALGVNSIWFPQTYLDLAVYFQEQGISWDQVDARQALSYEYSSAQGYQQVRQQIKSLPEAPQGGGCGA